MSASSKPDGSLCNPLYLLYITRSKTKETFLWVLPHEIALAVGWHDLQEYPTSETALFKRKSPVRIGGFCRGEDELKQKTAVRQLAAVSGIGKVSS